MPAVLRLIIVLAACLLVTAANAANADISKTTRSKITALFGSKKIVHDTGIKVRLNSVKQMSSGEWLVHGPYVDIDIIYKGRVRAIRAIAVLLDGNRRPLVARTLPGPSAPIREFTLQVQAMPDDYCDSHYRVVVVMQVKRKLIKKVVPIHVINPDCG